MMLQERLTADLYQAMRKGDTHRKEAIRMVKAAVQNAEIEWRRPASDEEVQTLIAREIKRRVEAIELFHKGHREDLVAQEEIEVAILREYLPQQLTREQVSEVVQRIVSETEAHGPAQLGSVMRQAMAELKGKADGRLVNEIVREVLGQ
jgi:uncharacterized protein YqeY